MASNTFVLTSSITGSVCNAYFSYLPNSGVLDWKLRTLGLSHASSKVQIQNGFILMFAGNGGDMPGGIRPALWLDIEGLELYDELPEYEQSVLDDGVMVDMCPMKSYLKPGNHAEVAINAGLKIRKEPAGAETGIQAFSGKDVKILNGPVCESGTVWFEIDFLGHRGWSMEGKDGTYYLKKTSGQQLQPLPRLNHPRHNSPAAAAKAAKALPIPPCVREIRLISSISPHCRCS